MTDLPTLILILSPSIVLVAGACAVAVWASRLPDEQSSLVARLTAEPHVIRATGKATRPAEPAEGNGAPPHGQANL